MRLCRWVGGMVAMFIAPCIANAGISFTVGFDDPAGELTAAAGAIESHVVAAGKRWAGHLVGNADIEVVVRTSSAVPYAEGRSLASTFVGNNGAFDVLEQGMAAEIRTGIDPNGSDPDVEIEINPSYVYDELWFDPDPYARTATVDINRTDAMSTFLHEFGHALGYNGWINGTTGGYPGNYQSTFDEIISFDGNNFYFNGSEAVTYYGAPVPLTFGNVFHVANFDPRPGADLLLDLMNGLVYYRGTRYDIEPLNVAMLRDSGVPAIYLAGDYDVDGVVDAADYIVWKATYGSSSSPFVDGNRNDRVDAADYTVWRNNMGISIFENGSGSLASVPEPASWLSMVVAAVYLPAFARYRVNGIPSCKVKVTAQRRH